MMSRERSTNDKKGALLELLEEESVQRRLEADMAPMSGGGAGTANAAIEKQYYRVLGKKAWRRDSD
jgi:hypothetical protein